VVAMAPVVRDCQIHGSPHSKIQAKYPAFKRTIVTAFAAIDSARHPSVSRRYPCLLARQGKHFGRPPVDYFPEGIFLIIIIYDL
jgi:hypothetical protein